MRDLGFYLSFQGRQRLNVTVPLNSPIYAFPIKV